MATVNRYTNIEPAKYNPMSLQELMLAPSYKRNQHDKLLENSETIDTELAKVDPLDIHAEAAAKERQKILDGVNNQVELLNRDGFNNNSKSNFMKLNREYKNALSPTGSLGKINAAKQALNTAKKAHIDQAIEEGFSPEEAQMNWQQHEQSYIDEYKATGEVTPISNLSSPKYVDYITEANNIFKAAGLTERDLAGGSISRIITTDPRGQYILNEGGGKITKTNRPHLEEAIKWLNNNINNPNSDLGKSIAYQGKSPSQVLSEIGNLAKVHLDDSQGNDYTRTITGFKSAKELGIDDQNLGDLSYASTDAQNITRFNEDMSNSLKNIIQGNLVSNSDGIKNINRSVGLGPIPFDTKREKASFKNSMSESQRAQYDKLYNGLKNIRPELAAYGPDSIESAKIISEYVENTGNMLHQDIIITDDLVKEYGNSTGSNPKSKDDMLEGIKTTRTHRKYAINGEEMDYDDLPSEIKIAINEGKVDYSGYMSPKNFRGFGKDSNKDLYVSPHILNYYDEDGESVEILVGRETGDSAKPDFKADRQFNDIYVNTKMTPNIPYKKEDLGANITYVPNSDDPSNGKYVLQSLTDPNRNEIVDESTLQSML